VRVLTTLVVVPFVAYLAVLFCLFVFQRQLLYFPDTSRPELGGLSALGVREVTLRTTDGLSLRSWHLPPRGDRPVIVYFHGNGGSIAHRTERLQRFGRQGYGVLMVEYRGYGGNPGSPSEVGLFDDARAAFDFLQHEGVAGHRLVLYGESLGTAVAVRMAAEREIGALVLESPFTSIAAVAQHHYPYVPATLLVQDRFDALSQIGAVRAPLLVLQGGRDRVVPARFGDILFDTAAEPKERWFAPEAGHEDLARYGALDVVAAFIARHVGQGPH
jgi:fermentation-respiration switch protein FrsA (DUF1100 family)